MKTIVSLLIIVAVGSSNAVVDEGFQPVLESILKLLDRNNKTLQDVNKKYDDLKNSEIISLDPYFKKIDDKIDGIIEQNSQLFEESIKKASSAEKVKFEKCKEAYEAKLDNTSPFKLYDITRRCFILHGEPPIVFETDEDFKINTNWLIERQGDFDRSARDCVGGIVKNFEVSQCLFQVRQEIQEDYLYKIFPLHMAIEHFYKYLPTEAQNAKKCTQDYVLMKEFWKQLEDTTERYKTCITKAKTVPS